MKSTSRPVIITAPQGLLPALKNELSKCGFPIVWASANAVGTRGDFNDTMRLNLNLRTAHHVLYQLSEFECQDLDALYSHVHAVPWETYIPADGYLSVAATVDHPSIRDHRIVNLKSKDAIVDRIAERKGRRPDSGPDKDETVIVVFWNRNRCSVYIDTSGQPLSRRDYRKIPLSAPMQETLAAGVIAATGYDGRGHFINPMCGSGTLAIEAALIARGRAPGLSRSNFGFMHTLLFDNNEWLKIRDEAVSKVRDGGAGGRIIATDNDPMAIEAARQNAVAAGVDGMIEFAAVDFPHTMVPQGEGVILFNPEYGIRLGNEEELVETYRSIGRFLKQSCQGYRAYIFTASSRLASNVGLKAGKKMNFQSGKIDCRLYEYLLFKGKGV